MDDPDDDLDFLEQQANEEYKPSLLEELNQKHDDYVNEVEKIKNMFR
jgi:hypothetical protein